MMSYISLILSNNKVINNNVFNFFRQLIQFKMPRNKEDRALIWANKSEEEKKLFRKKDAERKKLKRKESGQKKRSEMNSTQLAQVRAIDKTRKKKERIEMTEEQREKIKEKDRERARKRRKSRATNNNTEENEQKAKELSGCSKTGMLIEERKKMKVLTNNCKIKEKVRTKMTQDEIENIQVGEVNKMRDKRNKMTKNGKMLARLHARVGMREHRKFGFLREYKQRKKRDSFDPECWTKEPNPVSEYFKKVKEVETPEERKEELKRMNRIRVERHRMKVKKMLQEPIIMKTNCEKGPYELLREKNIKEFEELKKNSGLFD